METKALKATHILCIMTCLWFTSMFFTATAQSNGIGTFYTPPYQPSACYGFEDQGVMIAAASEALWNNGAACGHYYQVRCVGARNQGVPMPCHGSETVVVKIVDLCPPNSCRGTIDLSQEAFASIADPNAGDINIQYQLSGLNSTGNRSAARRGTDIRNPLHNNSSNNGVSKVSSSSISSFCSVLLLLNCTR